jgi:hypothetical protein
MTILDELTARIDEADEAGVPLERLDISYPEFVQLYEELREGLPEEAVFPQCFMVKGRSRLMFMGIPVFVTQ